MVVLYSVLRALVSLFVLYLLLDPGQVAADSGVHAWHAWLTESHMAGPDTSYLPHSIHVTHQRGATVTLQIIKDNS